MKRFLILMFGLASITGIQAQSNIPAIDVHSHIVTDEYLKYLADNDALMADGYPLPSYSLNPTLRHQLMKPSMPSTLSVPTVSNWPQA